MEKKNKYKKIFNIDAFLGTLFVFLTMFIFSFVFSADIFTPLKRVFEDFAITDINTDFREDNFIEPDTNIVLIDNSYLNIDETILLIEKINNFKPKIIGLEELDLNSLNSATVSILDSLINIMDQKIVIGYKLFDVEQSQKFDFYDSLKYSFYKKNQIVWAYNDLDFKNDKRFYTQREFYPSITADTGLILSFAVKISGYFKPESFNILKRSGGWELINYRGNYNKFFFYEGSELVNDDNPVNRFTDKIILIGNCPVFDTAKNLDELYFTPLNPNYTGRTFPDMFKLIILANIINMLICGSFYNTMPGVFIVIIAFVITYLNFILYLNVSKFKKELYELVSIFAFLFQSTIIIILTYYFYYTFNLDLKLTLTLIAIATTVFIFEAYIDSIKPFFLYIYSLTKKFFKNIFATKKSLMDI